MKTNNTIENKTIHLVSDTDLSVNVITNGGNYHAVEGFLVLPRRESGKQFIIATDKPYIHPSEILIASYENATKVSIILPQDLTGKTVSNSTITTTLAAYRTYMLKSIYDLSGTFIQSSRPISVTSGNAYAKPDGKYESYLVEQIPSIDVLGKDYLVPPLQGHRTYKLKLLSPTNHVLLKFYNSTGMFQFMLHRYLPLEMWNRNEPVFISSSQPVMVVQYGTGIMMIVPSISNYLQKYDFLVPTITASLNNYVSLISTSGDILLDSKKISAKNISLINTTKGNFTIITTIVTVGRHSITSASGSTYFGAMLYGHSTTTGYGFPLGIGTNNGKQDPNLLYLIFQMHVYVYNSCHLF